MHKGWWVAFWAVVLQLALGGAFYLFTHDDAGTEPPPTDVNAETDFDIDALLADAELMLVPATPLGALPESALAAARCARLCAVPGEGDSALAGSCSAPVRIAGLLDGDDGKQLVISLTAGSAPDAYAYLAAGERRVLLLAADRCDIPPADAQPPETDDESGEGA